MSTSVGELVAAIVLSSACSISMTLLNKFVMDTHRLDYPWGLLFLQNVSALLLVVAAKTLGFVQYPQLDVRVAKKWMPLTVLFVVMLYTSMRGIHDMSVAVMTILKNTATIIIAFGDAYMFGRKLSPGLLVAFAFMFFGAYLGSSTDRWVTVWGLFWTFSNVAATAAYVLYMKLLLVNVSSDIGRYGPVFYNNLLSLPFLIIPAAPTFADFVGDAIAAKPAGQIALAATILVGSVMTFATFWCMRVTSPTTYAVIGTMNKIPLLLLGIVLFEQPPTALGGAGMAAALAGGALYTYLTLPSSSGKVLAVTSDESPATSPLPPPLAGSGGLGPRTTL
jgi:GDP-mannose transporter